MTDTEREALCARIDELCAEVERLRKQLHDQHDTTEHNFVRNAREYKRVCEENAKLRELVRDMWREGAFEPGASYVTEAYGLAERTRELGIEVRA